VISPSNQITLNFVQSINPLLPIFVKSFPMHFTSSITRNMTVAHQGTRPHDYYIYRWVMVTRLFLPQLLRHSFFLYLDADTLCGRDFLPEIEEFLGPDKLVYGVIDIGVMIPYMRRYFEVHQFDMRTYINTGVLLLRNNEALRMYLNRTIQWVNDNYAWYPDQDGINAVFEPSTKMILPKKFNCHCCVRQHLNAEVFHHGRFLRLWAPMQRELEERVLDFEKSGAANDSSKDGFA
jgi:lipopolysaccharide biosynthesis glycosyltransferase